MELLGLRLRLEKEDLEREERREIEQRIRALDRSFRDNPSRRADPLK
jgi:hypothetical protein